MSEFVFRWKDNSQLPRNTAESSYSIHENEAIASLKWIEQFVRLNHPEIIMFPSNGHLRKQKDPIFTYQERWVNGETTLSIKTGNIIGIISHSDPISKTKTIVEIGSRFDSSEKQPFLMYLLSRVFGGAILPWTAQGASDNLWDVVLLILFGSQMQRAYRQGLFKQYVTKQYNNDSFKGTLNIPQFINKNMPFIGKISYTTREQSYDNPVLWFIRHVLNFIQNSHLINIWKAMYGSNQVIQDFVRIIKNATLSYSPNSALTRFIDFERPIRHPFFTEYELLRKLGLQILNRKGLGLYGGQSTQVQGILFDVSWLWESFVYDSLLEPLAYRHCEYKKHNGIPFFNDRTSQFYPDFLQEEKEIVMDAKYKSVWEKGHNVDDLHQIFSYMFLQGSHHGGVIYPVPYNSFYQDTKLEYIETAFNVHHGPFLFHRLPFVIPSPSQTVENFLNSMEMSIKDWNEKYSAQIKN